MAVADPSEAKAETLVEPWRAELEERIADEKSWGEQRDSEAAEIVLEMLLNYPKKGALAALEAALRIGADYWAKYLPSSQDPLNKPYMLEDKGMTMYLRRLYDLIFYQSWLLSYTDPRQDCLVQLMLELKKLPKVTYKGWAGEHYAYHNDPEFCSMSEDNWNGVFAYDQSGPDTTEETTDFIQRCNEWINFSSFLARYHGSDVYETWENHLKYPSIDIGLALEERLPAGRLRECRLLVASNWIIYSGRLIHADMKSTNKDSWSIERWKRWAEKIQELLDGGEQSKEVNSNLRLALEEMKAVDPTCVEGVQQ